jgi:hypothetical protein
VIIETVSDVTKSLHVIIARLRDDVNMLVEGKRLV